MADRACQTVKEHSYGHIAGVDLAHRPCVQVVRERRLIRVVHRSEEVLPPKLKDRGIIGLLYDGHAGVAKKTRGRG